MPSNSSVAAPRTHDARSTEPVHVVALGALNVIDVPFAEGSNHSLILKREAILWLHLPGASAKRFRVSIVEGDKALVSTTHEDTLQLAAGTYSLRVEGAEERSETSAHKGQIALQVRYLEGVGCSPEVARFAIRPFEGNVEVSSIFDLNQDGNPDFAAVYSVSPTQVATRLSIARPFPECVQSVLDVLGHVVPSNEFRTGWRRLYQLTAEAVPDEMPFELKRRFGFAWSVTRRLDFDASTGRYLPGASPIRCEKTDGVQMAYSETGPNPRATLIPDDLCTRYFSR